MLFRSTLAISTLCLLALLAGCGSSGSTSESSPEEEAPSSFVIETDGLCERLQRRYQPEKERVVADLEAMSTSRDQNRVSAEMRVLADKLEEYSARLGAVGVPPDKRREFDAMVSAKASQASSLRSEASAFESSDLAKVKAAQVQVAAKQERFGRFAKTLGLQQCGAENP